MESKKKAGLSKTKVIGKSKSSDNIMPDKVLGALDKYCIKTCRGVVCINPALIESQNVSPQNLLKIKEAHRYKDLLYSEMMAVDDRDKLKELAQRCTDTEYYLQVLWGFTEDAKYHKFWNMPKCTCPKMDNEDAYPTGNYVLSSDCIIHGGWLKTLEELKDLNGFKG